MNCCVTTRAPTGSLAHSRGMGRIANKYFAGRSLNLRMTLEAKVRIAFHQQLSIDRAMRIVANRASFPQGFMLKHKWAGLLAMTLRAVLI